MEFKDNNNERDHTENIRDMTVETQTSISQSRMTILQHHIKHFGNETPTELQELERKFRSSTSVYISRKERDIIAELISDNLKLLSIISKCNLTNAISEVSQLRDEREVYDSLVAEIVRSCEERIVHLMEEQGIDFDSIFCLILF